MHNHLSNKQVGNTMSEFPLDPQLAKMLVASPEFRWGSQTRGGVLVLLRGAPPGRRCACCVRIVRMSLNAWLLSGPLFHGLFSGPTQP